jgi:hypothetical protein
MTEDCIFRRRRRNGLSTIIKIRNLGSAALHRGGIIAPLAEALKRPARDENLLKTG